MKLIKLNDTKGQFLYSFLHPEYSKGHLIITDEDSFKKRGWKWVASKFTIFVFLILKEQTVSMKSHLKLVFVKAPPALWNTCGFTDVGFTNAYIFTLKVFICLWLSHMSHT